MSETDMDTLDLLLGIVADPALHRPTVQIDRAERLARKVYAALIEHDMAAIERVVAEAGDEWEAVRIETIRMVNGL